MTILTLAGAAALTVTSLFLLIYGGNLLLLSALALRLGAAPVPPALTETTARARGWTVCVQLPMFNERHVARRAIDAACALRWPRALLEVQVLDDSDDDTSRIVAEAVATHQAAGVRISHHRRAARTGFKAGALAAGTALTGATHLAVFDADFVPPPDFLLRLMPHFADPGVAYVQARWGHFNRNHSLLTRLLAAMIDFHFLVEQAVRTRSGWLSNFTGSAGIWRRAAIESAGGWDPRTVTEDLDLSYRAQLAGWRAVLREDVVVPQELPVSIDGYRGQQARWAQGSFQCAVLLLPAVLRSRLPLIVRFQAAMHLLGYVAPLMMLLQVSAYAGLVHSPFRAAAWAWGVILLFSLFSLAPPVCLLVGQFREGGSWATRMPAIFLWPVLGAGTSLTVLLGLLRALSGDQRFDRTPKYQVEAPGGAWWRSAYTAPGIPAAVVEVGAGLGCLTLATTAIRQHLALMAFFAALFAAGFLAMGLGSLAQGFRAGLSRVQAAGLPGLGRPAGPAAVSILIAVVLAAFTRLPEPFEDSYHHWLIAANLLTTGRLVDPLFQMQDTWLPGYHLLAAAVLALSGVWQLTALRLVNAALGVVSVVIVYRLAGDRRQGVLASLLLGLNPIFVLTTTSAVAEPLLLALLLAAVAAALAGHWPAATVLAGAACLTGTKAWLWLACLVVATMVAAAAGRCPAAVIRRTLIWVAPALALALTLEAGFGFGLHSLHRASAEAASASLRGSLPGGPAGRGVHFLGYFLLASLPVGLIAPLGLIRGVGDRRLLWLHAPSLLYLAAVSLLVEVGAYSGSHRYYLLALPSLALLAARGATWLWRPSAILAAAAAAATLIAFIPVLAGLAAGGRGLNAAGRSAAGLPGRLLTDSPAVAFWSHRPPDQIVGSAQMPGDPVSALTWLRRHGVSTLALEDIDYYRASLVFPSLARGRAQPPFIEVGGDTFSVPGGKPVHLYRLAPPQVEVLPGIALAAPDDAVPGTGRTASLARGPHLVGQTGSMAGEGAGFGVPIARFDDGWWFPGPGSSLAVDGAGTWVRVYQLTLRERETSGGRFAGFETGPSHGEIRVSYRPGPGTIGIELRAQHWRPGLREVVILHEESAAFDDLADPRRSLRGDGIGSWNPVPAAWARLRSGWLGVEWELPAPPAGGTMYAARELQLPDFDFSGLEWDLPPGLTSADYTISLRRAM